MPKILFLCLVLQNGKQIRATVYAGDYEKITENGTTREFYYLDGNVIVVKQGTNFNKYIAFMDSIGNILSVINGDGEKVFDADDGQLYKQLIIKGSYPNSKGVWQDGQFEFILNKEGFINHRFFRVIH